MIEIQELIQQHQTRNPLEIASNLGVQIIFAPLGHVNGFFSTSNRIKTIYINENLENQLLLFTIAHELGHAIMHPHANTPFLRTHTYFSVDKLEIEANIFAVNLLISDEELINQIQQENITLSQLSSIFGLHEKLIELRLKNFAIKLS